MDKLPSDRLVAEYNPEEWENYARSHLRNHAYDKEECDRQPLFGYTGWFNDVIDKLEPEYKSLNTQQLNSLARSYSFAASGLLGNNTGYADSTKLFRLPTGQNALNDAQLEQYKAAVSKAIAAYDRLKKLDPDFQTIVGTVGTKHANEILDSYLILLYFQNEQAARSMLKPGLYDDYLLKAAKNLLASCPKDAVLFTYGDNDTYTTLYVQAMENFRTDVAVANLSLLNVPRYCSYLYKGTPGAKPFKTSLPDAFFRQLHIIQEDGFTQNTVNADTFFRNLPRAELIYPGPEYLMYSMYIPMVALPQAPESASLPGQDLDTAYWTPSRGYVYSDDLVKLDLAATNAWKRPLCFSTTCDASSYEIFQGHLALEGLVFRLYPNLLGNLNGSSYNTPVSGKTSLDLWKNAFQWSLSDKPLKEEALPFYIAQFVAGLQTAKYLQMHDQCQGALAIVEILNANFTDAMQLRDGSWMNIVEIYAECGLLEPAEDLGLQIWANYKDGKLEKDELERMDDMAHKLQEIGETYGLERLKNLPK